MRVRGSFVGAIAALVAFVGATTALAGGGDVIIDFQQLEHNDSEIENHGFVYEEDGYRLSHPEDEPFEFATFGTQEPRYPGSTALFNNTVDGVITLEAIDKSLFTLKSIDISNLNNNGPTTVRFTGNLDNGDQVFASFTTSGSENQLETFFFDKTWTNLQSVVWVQEAPFHQFDNIAVNPIPAPGALALLGVGLVGVRRRRRA